MNSITYAVPHRAVVSALVAVLLLAGCATLAPSEGSAPSPAAAPSLVVYSGRNENLVGPLIELYRESSDQEVEVRYGGSAEMAATILEEGANSPASVFFAQDAGALGALADAGRCVQLPDSVLENIDDRFVSPDRSWVGASGRARVLVYNTDELTPDDLPAGVLDLVDEQWRGRVGWAPTNGSFQAFVTAMRIKLGDEATLAWLQGMVANDVLAFPNNTSIVEATGAGEISVGLVNHYYLFRFLSEAPDFPAANYHFPDGDVGSLINVAGACILDTADRAAAADFVAFLLSDVAQQYFADETNEYPLARGDFAINPQLQPLDAIDGPDLDLGDLADLQGTLDLLLEANALE